MERLGLRVRGRVQGVGYRWFVIQEANRLGLRGWVRNAADGSVEVRAEGPDNALSEFRQRLAEGPPAARVTEITDLPPSNEPLSAEFVVTR